jgi:hypothetical protein
MTARERPEQTIYVLTLRAEGPTTDAIHRLRRALKYLLRVCRLRAVSIDVHEIPDPPDDPRRP